MAALHYPCPFCGCDVEVGKPCPGCSRKKNTARKPPKPAPKSWTSQPHVDGLDLPDEDFDYDEFVAREFGRGPHRALRVKWYWWLLGVALLAVLLLTWLP